MTVRREILMVPKRGARVRVPLDGNVPELSGGVGGWAEINRPRRSPITEWETRPLYRLAFGGVFDGWPNRSVEHLVRALKAMGERRGADKSPPTIKVSGPIPHTDLDWVIEELSWRTGERRMSDGRLIRQYVTVLLVEHMTSKLAVSRAKGPAATATESAGSSTAPPKVYVVRAGDTLGGVAAHHLGDRNRWREIADLNGVRDPRRLAIGTELRIPT